MCKKESRRSADVSVIIPVYNSGEEAYRAVNSVARQTLLPQEVILIDDCSPQKQETEQWMQTIKREFSSCFDVTVIQQKTNEGPGSARNAGWDKARCQYIAFLDSDDVWHPQKLECQYRYMKEHTQVWLSCHHMKVIQDENAFDREMVSTDSLKIVKINPIRYLFKHYPKGGTPSVMIKNTDKIRFQKGKRYSEDYLVWLQYCFTHEAMLIDMCLAASFKDFYGAGGLSANLWRIEKGELDTLAVIRRMQYIGFPIWIAASMFSLLKFVRRVVITRDRQMRKG